MRVNQITENQNMLSDSDQEFDLMEDLLVFMKNDPIFYRKSYYPMVLKMRACAKKQKRFNKNKTLFPVIKTAYKNYCKKYGINPKNSQYTKDNVLRLMNNMYTEEMKNINNGEYD